MRRTRNQVAAFTLVEILVALALLGILVGVLTVTLTGSLGLNRKSQQQLEQTTRMQQMMEAVRGAWLSQANYDRACVPGLAAANDIDVKFINLDSRAQTLAGSAESVSSSNCGGQPLNLTSTGQPPAMRRILVSAGNSNQSSFTLRFDALRPE